MNKKFFIATALITLLSFSSLVYAQSPAVYNFSGFGGGLPSSAKIVDENVSPEKLSSTTTVSSEKNEVLIYALVFGGMAVAGGLALAVGLSTESGKAILQECTAELIGECISESFDVCVETACSGEMFKLAMPIYVP